MFYNFSPDPNTRVDIGRWGYQPVHMDNRNEEGANLQRGYVKVFYADGSVSTRLTTEAAKSAIYHDMLAHEKLHSIEAQWESVYGAGLA